MHTDTTIRFFISILVILINWILMKPGIGVRP